jgi:hypothetical protein
MCPAAIGVRPFDADHDVSGNQDGHTGAQVEIGRVCGRLRDGCADRLARGDRGEEGVGAARQPPHLDGKMWPGNERRFLCPLVDCIVVGMAIGLPNGDHREARFHQRYRRVQIEPQMRQLVGGKRDKSLAADRGNVSRMIGTGARGLQLGDVGKVLGASALPGAAQELREAIAIGE